MQAWLPTQPQLAADSASQQRIRELENEIAKMKSSQPDPPTTAGPDTPGASSTSPLHRAFHGQAAAPPTFDPSSLLVTPGSVDPWLEANQLASLLDTQFKKWLKKLKLPTHKAEVFHKHLKKVTNWWKDQPDSASATIQRVSVAMGINPLKLKNASTDEIVLKVMTVALTMHS